VLQPPYQQVVVDVVPAAGGRPRAAPVSPSALLPGGGGGDGGAVSMTRHREMQHMQQMTQSQSVVQTIDVRNDF